MFYVLSKLVWFLFQPSSLMLIAIAIGLLKRHRGAIDQGRKWLISGIVALTFFGLSPASDLLIAPLETRFPRASLGHGGVTGIIVLGGVEDGRSTSRRELMALSEAGERLTEAVALARQYPSARVVFSGGSEEVLRTKEPEAQTAGRLFSALGIDPGRVTLEDKSRNTAENALLSKALLSPKPGEHWVLVTSAWHMPRAIGCFRAIGFEVEPWPVDFRTPEHFDPFRFHSSIGEGLRRLDFATKEYLGLIIYRVTGKTSALLPGPN